MTKVNNLPEFYPELPDEKFDIIYCDPPWDYGGKMQFDKSSIKSENKDWKMDIFISAANFKYPTVKTKDLMKIPIQDICADMCTERWQVSCPWHVDGLCNAVFDANGVHVTRKRMLARMEGG